MNHLIAWIAAEADPNVNEDDDGPILSNPQGDGANVPLQGLVAHQFPGRAREAAGEAEAQLPSFAKDAKDGPPISVPEPLSDEEVADELYEENRERRIYRRRTVSMLRRYMRFSIETGRLPSVLGKEFFRAKVTAFTVVTFEDRVIFVHDMERCLERLDEFSRQLIARHVLQEHDQLETSKLLNCSERTVRSYVPIALDLLTHILMEVGMMDRLNSRRQNSCQGGKSDSNDASAWEQGK